MINHRMPLEPGPEEYCIQFAMHQTRKYHRQSWPVSGDFPRRILFCVGLEIEAHFSSILANSIGLLNPVLTRAVTLGIRDGSGQERDIASLTID